MASLRVSFWPYLMLGLCACPLGDVRVDGDGSADEVGSEESGGVDTTTEESTESETDEGEAEEGETDEGEGETEGEPPELVCGWTKTKVWTEELRSLWGAGDELIGGGGFDLVQRSGGEWFDQDGASAFGEILQVWGPSVGDSWATGLGPDGDTAQIAHHDGEQFSVEYTFPGYFFPEALTGAGSQVWAAASDYCEDPEDLCACIEQRTTLAHFDGQAWSEEQMPGEVFALWANDEVAFAAGEAVVCDTSTTGQIWRSEAGGDWVVDYEGLASIRQLWGVGDELWAAPHYGPFVLHRVEGEWIEEPLPWTGTVLALTGRGPDDVWALGQQGIVHYDGQSWSFVGDKPAVALPYTALVALDDSLAALSTDVTFGKYGYQRFDIWAIDEDDASSTSIYSRSNRIRPNRFAFSPEGEVVGVSDRMNESYRFDGAQWTVTHTQLGHGLTDLLGGADEGWAVREDSSEKTLFVWPVSGGELGLPLEPPEQGSFSTRGAVLDEDPEGATPWFSGYDSESQQLRVYQVVAEEWLDRTAGLEVPANYPILGEVAASKGRVFFGHYAGWVWGYEPDSATWEALPLPVDESNWLGLHSIAATDPKALWATFETALDEHYLFFWDGTSWTRADELWPALAGEDHWGPLAKASDTDLWMISEGREGGERLAHFDGTSWSLHEAPAEMGQGLWLGPWGDADVSYELSAGADYLFVTNHQRRWRLNRCDDQP